MIIQYLPLCSFLQAAQKTTAHRYGCTLPKSYMLAEYKHIQSWHTHKLAIAQTYTIKADAQALHYTELTPMHTNCMEHSTLSTKYKRLALTPAYRDHSTVARLIRRPWPFLDHYLDASTSQHNLQIRLKRSHKALDFKHYSHCCTPCVHVRLEG